MMLRDTMPGMPPLEATGAGPLPALAPLVDRPRMPGTLSGTPPVAPVGGGVETARSAAAEPELSVEAGRWCAGIFDLSIGHFFLVWGRGRNGGCVVATQAGVG